MCSISGQKREPTEEELTKLALGFTTTMEKLAEVMQQTYDPGAFLWTKRVSTGKEVVEQLQAAPWAYIQTEKVKDGE